MHYANAVKNKGNTPQSAQARADQVPNSAGGYAFAVSPQTMLERFLILGTDQPTYYASAEKLTDSAIAALKSMIAVDGQNVVRTIVAISVAGRAPKQDPGIFALAACAALGNLATRRDAFAAVPRVCRTGSTLLQFASYRRQFAGWGRGMRSAIADWYNDKDVSKLAYQVVKYGERSLWSHRDMFRKAHPLAPQADSSVDERRALYDFVMKRPNVELIAKCESLGIVDAYLRSRAENVPTEERVRLAGVLTHEMVPTEWKKDPAVWEALLPGMPMTALVRNLASMTTNGVLTPKSDATKVVLDKLGNAEAIRKARIHPVNVLTALGVYKGGRGIKGSNTWIPVPSIVNALDEAFYLAFPNVIPSGKRILVGLDVSGSMGCQAVPGLTSRDVCAAMSMVQVSTEPKVEVYGFTTSPSGNYGGKWTNDEAGFTKLPFAAGQRLDDVVRHVSGLPFGGTDCSLPMVYAERNNLAVDGFVVYTDSETWAGIIHPFQALNRYRKSSGIDAKLVVCGVTATDISIADPRDPGMLDVCGFDSSVPVVIADFMRGSPGDGANETED